MNTTKQKRACRFIIKRKDQGGGFVAPSGSEHSYTQNPLEARIFRTRKEAIRHRCPDNETIVDLNLYIAKKLSATSLRALAYV